MEMGVGRLHVGVLGPFEVRIGGTVAGPAGAKRRGLLAVLALDANSVVPVSRLIDQLWGEEPPASAVNIVQTYVSAWRKILGSDPLVTVGTGYRLELGAAQSDLLSYRELVSQARVAEAEARHAEAARLLGDALRLWRGPALVDLSGEAFHDRLAGRLEIERLAATESWARAVLLSGGDPSEVAADADGRPGPRATARDDDRAADVGTDRGRPAGRRAGRVLGDPAPVAHRARRRPRPGPGSHARAGPARRPHSAAADPCGGRWPRRETGPSPGAAWTRSSAATETCVRSRRF